MKKIEAHAIVIGTSQGGIEALSKLFAGLSKQFMIPLIIVYHRAINSSTDFIKSYFSDYTSLEIIEVSDNEKIKPRHIYFAPAGYHILIEDSNTICVYLDEPVNFSRPSIDVLFESASSVFKNKLIGILLTGANNDGAKGLSRIIHVGGYALVQDPKTAIASTMPQSAIDTCKVDQILPLNKIAEVLNQANRYYESEKISYEAG